METTEKIVESYCRYVKGWFTLPNIRCSGQYEVDLLALDTTTMDSIQRYHIETGVSISGGFSKLTAKPFSIDQLKNRTQQASQRRTIDFFTQRKFELPEIISTIEKYGFQPGNYQRVIVSWGWTDEAENKALEDKVFLWDFRSILREIAETSKRKKSYFTDDTLRTIQLLAKAINGVDPVTWTPLCYMKGVHDAENTSCIS